MDKPAKTAKRGRGRPRLEDAENSTVVTRDTIIDLAFEQSRTRSLDDISFVQLAGELGVVPGSLHYHLGTKDDLNSAILNRFYRHLLTQLRAIPPGLPWQDTIRRYATTLMQSEIEHRGAAEHIQAKPKFRLFQKVRAGETDYGAAFFDHSLQLFRDCGFDARNAALFYHVIGLHCLSAATSASAKFEPTVHEAFLRARVTDAMRKTAPGIDFGIDAFVKITAQEAFEIGLEALIDRFAKTRAGTGGPA